MIIAKNGNALNREIGSETYKADHIYMYNNMENIYMVDLSDVMDGEVFVFGGKIHCYMNISEAYDTISE